MKKVIVVALAAVALLTAVSFGHPITAEARKPGSSTTAASSITLNQAPVKLGDWVTFSYSFTGNVASPRIEVDCYQNGVMTFATAAPASDPVLLGGSGSVWLWSGGPATCTATLYYWDFHPNQTFMPLATTTFTAGG